MALISPTLRLVALEQAQTNFLLTFRKNLLGYESVDFVSIITLIKLVILSTASKVEEVLKERKSNNIFIYTHIAIYFCSANL